MPRRARIVLPGYPHHLIQRGANKAECFASDRERRTYLGLLDELAEMYGCAVHAYVLMDNHVHLLMTPQRSDGPSLLMKHLGQRFVQYVNRKHLRSGPLWGGRFRSCVVDSDEYLMCCYRYIELNPVRAGMVRAPAEFEWSSYRTNAQGEPSLFLAPHRNYLSLGPSPLEQRSAYRRLFAENLSSQRVAQIRNATNSGSALGNEAFVAAVERAIGRPARNGRAGRPPGASTELVLPIGNRATSPVQ